MTSLTRELKQREDLIRVLTTDRDNAIATLRQRGLTIDHNAKVQRPISRKLSAVPVIGIPNYNGPFTLNFSLK